MYHATPKRVTNTKLQCWDEAHSQRATKAEVGRAGVPAHIAPIEQATYSVHQVVLGSIPMSIENQAAAAREPPASRVTTSNHQT